MTFLKSIFISLLILAFLAAAIHPNKVQIKEIFLTLQGSFSRSGPAGLVGCSIIVCQDLPAIWALGKTRTQLIESFGVPKKEFKILEDPQIFGIEPTSFLRGDTELDFENPECKVCIRADRCIGVKPLRNGYGCFIYESP